MPGFEWQTILSPTEEDDTEYHRCTVEGESVASVRRVGRVVTAELRWEDGEGGVEPFELESTTGPLTSVQEAKELVESMLTPSSSQPE